MPSPHRRRRTIPCRRAGLCAQHVHGVCPRAASLGWHSPVGAGVTAAGSARRSPTRPGRRRLPPARHNGRHPRSPSVRAGGTSESPTRPTGRVSRARRPGPAAVIWLPARPCPHANPQPARTGGRPRPTYRRRRRRDRCLRCLRLDSVTLRSPPPASIGSAAGILYQRRR